MVVVAAAATATEAAVTETAVVAVLSAVLVLTAVTVVAAKVSYIKWIMKKNIYVYNKIYASNSIV